jgi:glutamyl-tRNA synthetase
MNGEYIRSAPLELLTGLTIEALEAQPDAASLRTEREHVAKVCELMRERMRTVVELVQNSRYFFASDLQLRWDEQAVAKRAGTAEARARLREVTDALRETATMPGAVWDRTAIEAAVRALAERTAHKAGEFIGPLRVAITGTAVSAGIFETAEVLGAHVTLGRAEAFLRTYGAVPA